MNKVNQMGQNEEKVRSLVLNLSQEDGLRREHARQKLEKMGRQVTPFLLEALRSDNGSVRWEVVKALQVIKDRDAVPALIERLHDDLFEVRWVAAESLIQLGYDHVALPLLTELKKNDKSEYIRNGVHHILRVLKEKGGLPPEIDKILHEIWSLNSELTLYKDLVRAIDYLKQH